MKHENLLSELLDYMQTNNCSDLHIVVNLNPCVRRYGEINILTEYPVLTKEIIEDVFIKQLLKNQEQKMEELKRNKQVDSSFEVDKFRYRVNIFSQRNNYGIVLRKIDNKIPSLFELGLPDVVKEFTQMKNGLVLVTGPTGSGKSTTLAAMIDLINSTQKKHIITVEDPIEFVHQNKLSIVNQREIGQDVASFDMAVRATLREDPDIVLVGELRDLETISNALTVAETGHLVFGTLHTVSAAKSIDRIIDVFEPKQQQQVRTQLANILQGVISQLLLPKIGGGLVCASEVMIVNDAIRGIIQDGKQISRINDQIGISRRKLGTQTMDQCLASLYLNKKITLETAKQYSTDAETLNRMIAMGV